MNKDGSFPDWFVNGWNTLVGRSGGEAYNALYGVINGQARQQATNQAAIDAASAAAAAAIAASGSTETDSKSASGLSVSSATFATVLTCSLDHAGGGGYSVTAAASLAAITGDALIADSGAFDGAWQIIENPNAHVLASGTFSASSLFQGAEGGQTPFYANIITFSASFPTSPANYAANESGPVTIELQLRRVIAANTLSELSASLLTMWSP